MSEDSRLYVLHQFKVEQGVVWFSDEVSVSLRVIQVEVTLSKARHDRLHHTPNTHRVSSSLETACIDEYARD